MRASVWSLPQVVANAIAALSEICANSDEQLNLDSALVSKLLAAVNESAECVARARLARPLEAAERIPLLTQSRKRRVFFWGGTEIKKKRKK